MIAPVFEALSKQHTNVNFLKCDVDQAKDVAGHYSISAMWVDGEWLWDFVLTRNCRTGRPSFSWREVPKLIRSEEQTESESFSPSNAVFFNLFHFIVLFSPLSRNGHLLPQAHLPERVKPWAVPHLHPHRNLELLITVLPLGPTWTLIWRSSLVSWVLTLFSGSWVNHPSFCVHIFISRILVFNVIIPANGSFRAKSMVCKIVHVMSLLR